jgi:hypothetical protein
MWLRCCAPGLSAFAACGWVNGQTAFWTLAKETRLVAVVLVLSIHLHPSQGWPPPSNLSSRPKRTRISYITTPPKPAHAAFRKESRTKFANATDLDRKFGVA